MSFQEPNLTNNITTKSYMMFSWGEKREDVKWGKKIRFFNYLVWSKKRVERKWWWVEFFPRANQFFPPKF